jgi:ATP-dependent HslUV protease ATP-binding subunit HslU
MDEVSKKSYREQLRSGALDNQTVEVDVASKDDFTSGAQNSIGGEMIFNLRRVLTGRRTERRKLTIREARPLVEELEMEKMVANEDVYKG